MEMRLLMSVAGALVFACALCACSSTPDAVLSAQTTARRGYDQSVANYENCIAAHPSRPSVCERQRRIMDADD
jgi:hypothetical protein